MEKSNHKNFVETYERDWDTLIQNEILPYQEAIFDLFSAKFKHDAEQDLKRWRKKLFELWQNCANKFEEIHSILKDECFYDNNEDEIFNFVQNIVNMDYWSVYEFFCTLKKNFANNPEINMLLDDICNNISEMRRISKKHTNIIELKEEPNHK